MSDPNPDDSSDPYKILGIASGADARTIKRRTGAWPIGDDRDMLEQFLMTINQWMTAGSAIALSGAFLWGMVSVLFSPCHLASIPLMVAYVGGQQNAIHPLLFALGHCLPIAAAGGSTAMMRKLTECGAWQGVGLWFRRAAGTLIALLGVYFIAKPLVGV